MEFPLAFGLQQVGLPLIVTSGKLENLCFLIDTGSSHNLLFDFVYKHFQDEFKLLENTQQAMGIEGHYVECPIIEATFCFEGKDCTSDFLVIDVSTAVAQIQKESGGQIHGILGIPFLIEQKWILDFENYLVRSNESA